MSRRFQYFVDNFLKGAMLGSHWIQLAQQADDRKEQRAIARERNRITAANHAERMALERQKMAGTSDLQRAQADWYRRRSAGGAGGGGGSAGAQQFIGEMGNAGIDVSEPTPRQQPMAVQTEQEPPAATYEPTPADTDDGYARGGRVRGRQLMGAVMQGAQGALNRMNRPLPSPGAVPAQPDVRPVGPQGSGPGGSYAVGDFPSLQMGAGTSGPGSGLGDTAAPPVMPAPTSAISTGVPDMTSTAPDMTSAGPDTSAFDQSYGMDMVRRGGRIRGPKRPKVRGFQEGGSVEDSRKIDRQTRSTYSRLNAERAGLYNDPLFDRPVRRQMNEQISAGEREQRSSPPPRFAGGGSVPIPVPDDYVDDPRLSPEERWRRAREAAFPSGQRQRDFEASLPAPGYPGDSAGRLRNQWREQGDLYNDEQRQRQSRPMPNPAVPEDTDFPLTRDPGETGGFPDRPAGSYPPPPEGDMPLPEFGRQVAGGPGGGGRSRQAPGGGRGAISTDQPWKALGDQSRTAAYDPERDMADPRNIHAVDTSGRTQAWVNQRVTMDDKGQVARIDNPATDYTTGAAAYATALGAKHPAEVYNGAGAADPKMMDRLMKTIDPDGRMPVSQRMEMATKVAHEFFMQQGDPAGANEVAGQITQYGVQQSRPFGVNAMKAAQSGDMQTAVQQLIQGYDHLPNGQHATVQGNQIVVVDQRGKPVMNIPINPQTIQNLALGMATGKLGWDVMGYTPQQAQPPTATRPAAQPSAAPAGPSAPTPAAPTAPRPGAPAAPAQAVQTTAPQPPAAPPSQPRPPGAPPPPAAQPTQAVQTPPGAGDTQTDPDEERLRKNPRAVLPATDRATAGEPRDLSGYIDLKRRAETEYMNQRKQIMQRGAQLLGKGESRYLTQALQAHKARFDAHMKEINDEIKRLQNVQQQGETHDVNVETRPRDVSLNDEVNMQGAFDKRIKEIGANPDLAKNTVLQNLPSPADQRPVYDLARQIWQQNRGISMEQALNYALGVTSIKPEGEGMNLGTGKDALQFRTRRNQRGGLSLELPSGEKILTDRNTFTAINNLQRKNWQAYEAAKKKADTDKAERAKRTEGLAGRAGRAIMDIVPIPPTSDYARQRAGDQGME